jgi:hypothetical protein
MRRDPSVSPDHLEAARSMTLKMEATIRSQASFIFMANFTCMSRPSTIIYLVEAQGTDSVDKINAISYTHMPYGHHRSAILTRAT